MLPRLIHLARRSLHGRRSPPSNGRDGWGDEARGLLLRLVLVFLLLAEVAGAQTNGEVDPPSSGLKLPDLGSLKVGGVQVGVAPVEVSGANAGLPFEVRNTSEPVAAPTPAQRGEIVAAPVPSLSPTFGFGIAGGVGYIYHPSGQGTDSPPWVTGAGAFYAENGSWGGGLGHKMNLAQDRWRLLGFGGYANVRYDFFGIGQAAGENDSFVSLSQNVAGGLVEGLYRVSGPFYAGVRYSFAHVTTGYEGSSLPPHINDLLKGRQVDAVLSAPALRLQWDTRDSQFSPTRGWFVDGEAAFFDEAFGSDFTYQAVSLLANRYWGIAEGHLLAFSSYGRFSFGRVPFFGLSRFGAKNQLRGYPMGRYQDRMLLAGQAEYRFQVTQRFGVVAFGGVGAVAPDFGEFRHANPLPSGGFGIRYLLAKANKVNFRVDVAWGKDGHAVYLGVGEAF